MAPPCPSKEHLKKISYWSAQLLRGRYNGMLWVVFRERRHRVLLCSGQTCSGEGLEWGMWERRREEGGELFRAGLLLLSVSKMSLEAPTLETYFQNQNIWERLGPFQRLDKSGDTSEKQNYTTEGNVKASTQPPKLKISGFSDPARMALWPPPRLLNTHSSYMQVLPWESLGRWLCKQ